MKLIFQFLNKEFHQLKDFKISNTDKNAIVFYFAVKELLIIFSLKNITLRADLLSNRLSRPEVEEIIFSSEVVNSKKVV
jgi:hypothetical protein